MSGHNKEPLRRYRREDIDDMANRLEALGFGNTWAGLQSRHVLALIDDANQRLTPFGQDVAGREPLRLRRIQPGQGRPGYQGERA